MQIHIVTTKSTDKTTDGRINFVRMRCHGVFSDETIADAVAERFGGQKKTFNADELITGGVVLQYWENPGFVD